MSAPDDIVPRLRLWAEGLEKQKAVVLAVAITEASAEIERLRKERDEARREVCWCDVSVRELKAIVATCELMGINQ